MTGMIQLTKKMNKKELDIWFSKKYTWIVGIAKSHIFLNNRTICPYDLTSDAYIYISSIITNIEDEKTLETYTSRFIIMECKWFNSKSNKQSVKGYDLEGKEFDIIDDDNQDVQDKIDFEKWYNDSRCKLEQYRMTIEKKDELIFFDVYFRIAQNGINPSVRKIAKHFSISSTSAHKLISELRTKLNTFISENN